MMFISNKMLELLLVLMLTMSVQGQLSVTWNGTTITGPVLIYHDELPVDPSVTTIGDTNGPGALICRSEDRARVSWHYFNGFTVKGPEFTTEIYIQIRREGVVPSLAQLLLKRENTAVTNSNFNSIWHCRLNARGHIDSNGATYEEQINVGIYSRGGGRGTISSPQISLQFSSFGSNPPTFTLVGDTHGGPPTTYTWSRNGQVITDGGPYNISIAVNGISEAVYRQSRYRSTLTVTGILPGVYQYSVTNRATTDTRTRSFTIKAAPLAPANLMAIQNTQTTVQVSWNGQLGSMYRVTAEPGNFSVITPPSSHTIALLPGVYKISVQSVPQHYGETVIVGPVEVTVKGILSPNVTTSSVTATSVTVSWTQPPFSFTPVHYTVTLRRVTGSGQVLCSTVEDNRPPVTIMPTVTSMQFTGLLEFSVYRVTVSAIFGEFGLSLTVPSSTQFATLSASLPEVPRDVRITTTSRSVSVSWNSLLCIDTITGFRVEFQEQGGARIPGEVVGQTLTASGLTPHTNYTFRVAAVNTNGTGPFSAITIITTNEDVPGIISDFMAKPSFTSILLTWSPPEEPNGVIIAYEVTYTVNNNEPIIINTTNTTHILRKAFSTNISVRAYTSVGPGVTSQYFNVSTIPPIVADVCVELLTETIVRVMWSQIPADEVTHYTVYYRQFDSRIQSELSVTVPSSENSVVIGNLMTNVEYQFQVAVTAELGGDTFHGERSTIITAVAAPTMTLSEMKVTCTRDISIAVVLTFLLTIILCAVIWLVWFTIYRTHHSNRNKSGGVGTKQGAVYEEVNTNLREGKDSGEMDMKENEAYGPVTATQQPQDYIYEAM